MATYKGKLLTWQQEWQYNQDEGQFHVVRGRGRLAEVANFVEGYRIQGYDITIAQSPAYSDFTCTRNFQYVDRPYIERWTLATEILEKDIWSHPDVMEGMYTYPDGPAAYKKAVEDAVSDGTSISVTPTWLIRELSRGVEAYEHEYHVLTRNLTFDRLTADNLPTPFNMTLQLSRQIISSNELQATQDIPTEVLFNLPADRTGADLAKDAASFVQWGWRVREQRAEIDTSTTGTFQMSWTYAAWSTFLYTPYP